DTGVVINSVPLHDVVSMDYDIHYAAMDPFVDLPPGKVFTVDEFMPLDLFYESDFYQQYLKETKIVHILGADMYDELGNSATLRFARTEGSDNFGNGERHLCEQILPHLQQAIRLHARIMRIESEADLFADAVDQLAMGTIILDEGGAVRRTNKAADRLLDTGKLVKIEGGSLRLPTPSQTREFKGLLAEVMAAHSRAEPGFVKVFRVRTLDGSPDAGILLRPLPLVAASDGSRNPSVAIFISDPDRPRAAQKHVLIELFGLTPAEATLALKLASGATLEEAAEQSGVTRNTAKSHLSAVFSKTGTTRQVNLVQLILESVATLGERQS
ncbi:MAG: DNA-binding CsgD family transcriptional regulator/PAS domain-containing protein, partial [Halieaceae bacterium]